MNYKTILESAPLYISNELPEFPGIPLQLKQKMPRNIFSRIQSAPFVLILDTQTLMPETPLNEYSNTSKQRYYTPYTNLALLCQAVPDDNGDYNSGHLNILQKVLIEDLTDYPLRCKFSRIPDIEIENDQLSKIFQYITEIFPDLENEIDADTPLNIQLSSFIHSLHNNISNSRLPFQAQWTLFSARNADTVEAFFRNHSEAIKKALKDAKNEEMIQKANSSMAIQQNMPLIRSQIQHLIGGNGSADDLKTQLEENGMPEECIATIFEELSHAISGQSEADKVLQWAQFAVELPWKKVEPVPYDLNTARDLLNETHYGMDDVKERIIEHLAAMSLNPTKMGSTILLVGPPGTGKTSLVKSIAKAMQRPYGRLALGGVRDQSFLRGHSRTYVGSMPGQILNTMKQVKATNPVIVLDEIDKISSETNAPYSALLEILDPGQNDTFKDHYLNMPYNLSDVFFVATANSLDTIPAPLLDRMEIIELSSYTPEEKFHITKEHLISSILSKYSIPEERLHLTDAAIESLIDNYTREGGVRGLEKRVEKIIRSKCEAILTQNDDILIDTEDLQSILGPNQNSIQKIKDSNPAGVVTGLAYTAVGGCTLMIETTDMPGTGRLLLTGHLGEVMKESAQIGLSLLKSRLPMDENYLSKRDIHIHFPQGATPKDGPSAGITITTALASLILNKPVDSHLAMTGEISLRGDVLPIGGLREKLYGAQRAGITTVLIPKDNMDDLWNIPQSLKDQIRIIPVSTIEDVLNLTLNAQNVLTDHVLDHTPSCEPLVLSL